MVGRAHPRLGFLLVAYLMEVDVADKLARCRFFFQRRHNGVDGVILVFLTVGDDIDPVPTLVLHRSKVVLQRRLQADREPQEGK